MASPTRSASITRRRPRCSPGAPNCICCGRAAARASHPSRSTTWSPSTRRSSPCSTSATPLSRSSTKSDWSARAFRPAHSASRDPWRPTRRSAAWPIRPYAGRRRAPCPAPPASALRRRARRRPAPRPRRCAPTRGGLRDGEGEQKEPVMTAAPSVRAPLVAGEEARHMGAHAQSLASTALRRMPGSDGLSHGSSGRPKCPCNAVSA